MNLSTVPALQLIDPSSASGSGSAMDLRGVVVLGVDGDVDIYTAPTLLQTLQGVLASPTARRADAADDAPGARAEARAEMTALVVDLAQVDFIDSSAIGVLVQGHHLARRSGRGYALLATHPMIHALFQLTGLAKVLPLHPDVMTAVTYLHPAVRPSCL